MSLSDKDIADLVVATLDELGRLKFQQIAQTIQNFEVLPRILRKDRVEFQSGTGIQRTVMVDTSNAAKNVGLFQEDVVNVGDVLASMNVVWKHTTTNWAYERREMLMNRSKSRIVSLVKVRRTDALLSLAERIETDFWNKPTDSTDTNPIFGIPYWIVKSSTTGFNGGDPSGFTSGAGGLDVSTYPTWKNYTARFDDVTKDDCIKKLRTAHRKIRFKSPVNVPDFRRGNGDQYRLYVGETTISSLEDLGEAQNENLGRDLASMDGTMTFRKHPIIWVPELDSDTDKPIYMVNFATTHPVILRGDNLTETEPRLVANQHNVRAVHIDLTWNLLCIDRRRNAVLYEY